MMSNLHQTVYERKLDVYKQADVIRFMMDAVT